MSCNATHYVSRSTSITLAQVGSSATLGTTSTLAGTVLAYTSITANAGAVINGQLLALNGAVTLISDVVTLPALCTVSSAAAAVNPLPISLGAAASFAVLASSAFTNTGDSTITGNLGVSPGTAVSGSPPAILIGGTVHVADAVSIAGRNALYNAINSVSNLMSSTTVAGDVGGLTLTSGVYTSDSSLAITGILTLHGTANSVFVFQVGTSFIMATGSAIILTGGAQACNTFWQVSACPPNEPTGFRASSA